MRLRIVSTSLALLLASSVFAPPAHATAPNIVTVDAPVEVAGPLLAAQLADVSADGSLALYYRLAPSAEIPGSVWYQPFVRNFATGVDTVLSTQDGTTNQFGNGTPRLSLDSFTADGSRVLFSGPNGRLDASLSKSAVNEMAVYIRDLATGDNQLVDVNSAGVGANRASEPNGISQDGRYVVFSSDATNLVSNPVGFNPSNPSIFFYTSTYVRDLTTGTTLEVAPGQDGYYSGLSASWARGTTFRAMSSNGRFIAVADGASTWLYDVAANSYERLTITGSDNSSRVWDISDDGNEIAFTTLNRLSSEDAPFGMDAYILNRATGAMTFVSRSTNGVDGTAICGFAICHGRGYEMYDVYFVGADGLVAFTTLERLAAGDPAAARPIDLYLRDTIAGTTSLVSGPPAGPNAYLTNGFAATDAGDAIFFTTATAEFRFPTKFWRAAITATPADSAAPVVTGTPDSSPNANGWSPLGTTIAWTSVDPEPSSGPPTTPAASVVATEGANQTITSGQSCDPVGNCSTGSYVVSVDATPPDLSASTLQLPQAGTDWFNTDVSFFWTCSDALSGIQDACPSASEVSGEGENLTVSTVVSDRAGNTTSATTPPIAIDRTAPVTEVTAPSGWSNHDLTLTAAATDNLSGVAHTYFSIDGQPTQTGTTLTVTGQGDHTIDYWSVDLAGNTEPTKTATVSLEYDGPDVIASVSPEPNGAGWNNSVVTITTVCTDALSGIASCTAPIILSLDGANQTVEVSGTDGAGNTTSRSITVNIDTVSPVVDVTGASHGGVYDLATAPSPTCTTSDATSGVAIAAALTVSRDLTGRYSVNCDGALDAAGNSTAGISVTYRVVPSAQSLLALTYQVIDNSQIGNKVAAKANAAVLLRVNTCAYIHRIEAYKSAGTLTAEQVAELRYWALVLSPSCKV